MSRYIDADETLEQIRKKLGIKSLDYLLEAERQIVDAIQSAPSIDIVRCKDCKYWVSDGGALMKCDIHKDPTVPDHYCSYGEKDKDEQA